MFSENRAGPGFVGPDRALRVGNDPDCVWVIVNRDKFADRGACLASACVTQLCRVCALQPIFPEIDTIVAYCEACS